MATTHVFGGEWTRLKLEILEKYLEIYTTALKDQSFTLHYVDAFAGTGQRDDEDRGASPLIELEALEGSVRIALGCRHPFDHYHFNDLNPEHVKALHELSADFPDRNIHISQLDANEFVMKFCRNLQRNERAVIFLDPYSSAINWSTLREIVETKKADLWMLFPISTLLRIMPQSGPREEWRQCIERMLGTTDWEAACYEEEPSATQDLFGELEPRQRRADYEKVIQFVTKRLQDAFPYVEEPVWLKQNGSLLFLFYFAVSNPEPRAWGLAKKLVKAIKPKR